MTFGETAEKMIADGRYGELFSVLQKEDKNDADVCFYLSLCYECGFGTEKNDNLAALWCKRAAELGNSRAEEKLKDVTEEKLVSAYYEFAETDKYAALCLAREYKIGRYVNRCMSESYAKFMLAKDEFPEAEYETGVCREKGRGCERDMSLALDAYISAAERGYEKAKAALERLKNRTREVQNLIDAAANLDPSAQYALGKCYEYGDGTEELPEYAFSLYCAAEQAGNTDAAFRLGFMYENGLETAKKEQKAFEMYEKAAKAGKMRYCLSLAYCCEYGLGTEINTERAAELYTQAYKKGSIIAAYNIARCAASGKLNSKFSDEVYEAFTGGRLNFSQAEADEYVTDAWHGDKKAQFYLGILYGFAGDEERDTDAYEMFSYSAEKGYLPAVFMLGKALETGCGAQKDEEAARALYERAAGEGFVPACYRSGLLLIDGEDERAAEYFAKAAEKHHAPSMLFLSYMYDTGKGTERNESYAYYLTQQAFAFSSTLKPSERDEIRSLCYTYDFALYLAGLFSEIADRQSDEALSFYYAAAEKGSVCAHFRIADIYSRGVCGIVRNDFKAFELFCEAGDMGSSQAVYRAGIMYRDGIGTEKNTEKAFGTLQMAAALGNADALFALGEFYEKGICCLMDMSEALDLYRSAARKKHIKAREIVEERMRSLKLLSIDIHSAKNGDAQAQYRLYEAYLNGICVEENEEEAYRWLVKSAEGGCPAAQYTLGRSYETGLHFERDVKTAIYWYKQAKGYEPAVSRLKQLDDERELYRLFKKSFTDISGTLPLLGKNKRALLACAKRGRVWAMYLYALFLELSETNDKGRFEALTWYKTAAAKGYHLCSYRAGEMIFGLRKQGKSTADAFTYFHRAAVHNIKEAMYMTGYCYEHGCCVDINPYMAFEWYEKARKKGHARAACALGRLYDDGRGCERDEEKAKALYAESGTALSKYRLALLLLRDETQKFAAAALMSESANAGNPYAQIQCGIWKMLGTYSARDEKGAYALFSAAAKSGDSMAHYLVGMCRESGRGVKKTSGQSSFEISSKLFNPQATYALSKLYREENGQRADMLLRNAALWGCEKAYDDMKAKQPENKLFVSLFGIKREPHLLAKAAVNGDMQACFELGLCLEYGHNIGKDIKKAAAIYRRASEKGLCAATERLCLLYESGKIEYVGDEAYRLALTAKEAGSELCAKKIAGIASMN